MYAFLESRPYFSAKDAGEKVLINGSFDANIWYSYDNDTKTTVTSKKITYIEEEKLNVPSNDVTNKNVIIRALKQPTCISAKEEDNTINLEIEKELGIEIVGDTKVKISSVDDTDDDWTNLDNDTDTNNEIDNINTDYINEEIIK